MNVDFECVMSHNNCLVKVVKWRPEIFGCEFFVIEEDHKQKLVVLCCFTDKDNIKNRFMGEFNVVRPIRFENVVLK